MQSIPVLVTTLESSSCCRFYVVWIKRKKFGNPEPLKYTGLWENHCCLLVSFPRTASVFWVQTQPCVWSHRKHQRVAPPSRVCTFRGTVGRLLGTRIPKDTTICFTWPSHTHLSKVFKIKKTGSLWGRERAKSTKFESFSGKTPLIEFRQSFDKKVSSSVTFIEWLIEWQSQIALSWTINYLPGLLFRFLFCWIPRSHLTGFGPHLISVSPCQVTCSSLPTLVSLTQCFSKVVSPFLYLTLKFLHWNSFHQIVMTITKLWKALITQTCLLLSSCAVKQNSVSYKSTFLYLWLLWTLFDGAFQSHFPPSEKQKGIIWASSISWKRLWFLISVQFCHKAVDSCINVRRAQRYKLSRQNNHWHKKPAFPKHQLATKGQIRSNQCRFKK